VFLPAIMIWGQQPLSLPLNCLLAHIWQLQVPEVFPGRTSDIGSPSRDPIVPNVAAMLGLEAASDQQNIARSEYVEGCLLR
jgi:hypothetical protein